MPIASPRYAFRPALVSAAPCDSGVYALWEGEELIYYGRAQGSATVQSRLREHLEQRARCLSRATHYGWEIAANPNLRRGGAPRRVPARARPAASLQRRPAIAAGHDPCLEAGMDRDTRIELYLALLLLGADPMLLGAVERTDDRELLTDLRNWNEAKLLELKEWLPSMTSTELDAAQARIQQYEEMRETLRQTPRKAA